MNPIVAFITAICVGAAFFYLRYQDDEKFNEWFIQLKERASYFGYTFDEIQNFDAAIWRNYYNEALDIEEAIKKNLSEE